MNICGVFRWSAVNVVLQDGPARSRGRHGDGRSPGQSLLQTPVIKACLLGQTPSSHPCSSLCLILSCIIDAALLFSFESALKHHVRAGTVFIFAAKAKQDDPQSSKQAGRL